MIKASIIKEKCYELGADAVGIAKPTLIKTADIFVKRSQNEFPPGLHYLNKRVDERVNPEKLFPNVKSIVSIGVNYYPTTEDIQKSSRPYKVAKYAWGKDYHNVIRKKLKKLRNYLREIRPELSGKICVDTAPFADVYWAQQAGLGWQGKQSLLISKQFGVRLMLGALLINDEVDAYNRSHLDHCGSCTACIDACPTGAISGPFWIDAEKCISYHTIESKDKNIPDHISKSLNRFVFGCDLCSDACPFNRFQKERKEPLFKKLDSTTEVERGSIIDLSPKDFKLNFAGSPIYRPGLDGMRRNINSAKKSD